MPAATSRMEPLCKLLRTFGAMRLLALFFAFYFLVLSCRACADEPVCPDEAAACSAAPQSGPCPDEPMADGCSPLCQCHCCPGFALPLAPLTWGATLQVPSALPTYAAARVPSVPACLADTPWQPPKRA